MTIKITYEAAAAEHSQAYFKIALKYTLIDSILKKHFKILMRLTTLRYDYKTKSGLINEENKAEFLVLAEEIDNSNSKRCKTSHKKSIEKKSKKTESRKNNSVNCDHSDLGSVGYVHGDIVTCPNCGQRAEVW